MFSCPVPLSRGTMMVTAETTLGQIQLSPVWSGVRGLRVRLVDKPLLEPVARGEISRLVRRTTDLIAEVGTSSLIVRPQELEVP